MTLPLADAFIRQAAFIIRCLPHLASTDSRRRGGKKTWQRQQRGSDGPPWQLLTSPAVTCFHFCHLTLSCFHTRPQVLDNTQQKTTLPFAAITLVASLHLWHLPFDPLLLIFYYNFTEIKPFTFQLLQQKPITHKQSDFKKSHHCISKAATVK